MTSTYRQYKNYKIKVTPYRSEAVVLYRYTVKGTDINDVATNFDEAVCCAMDDIETYLNNL